MFKFNSIRKQLVFTICLFLALLLGDIAFVTYTYFRHSTQKIIYDQQFSMITSMAKGLDDKISTSHNALIAVSKVAPVDIVDNRQVTQKWLENRTGIRTIFNHGLFILDPAGKMIATSPVVPKLHGTSYSHREYFINTIKKNKPQISQPFISTVNGHPIVMMTSLINGSDGSVKGLLCGAIDIQKKEGIFEALRNVRVGSTGYLCLFAPDRTIISHPDQSRIMKRDIKPGDNKLFDRSLEGFEGSGETINYKGLRYLASFKRLQSTGWILAANYPVAEAYQPITSFRNYYLLGMFVAMLIAMAMVWVLGNSIAGPLTGFTMSIISLAKSDSDKKQRLDENRADELGLLAGSFNVLLDELQRREKELQDSEEKFRTVADYTYNWEYWIGETGSLIYVSPSCERITGYTAEEFQQNPELFISIINPDDRDKFMHHFEVGINGVTKSDCYTPDFRIQTRSGEERWIAHICQEVFDHEGKSLGRRACNRDITMGKWAEQELHNKNTELERFTYTVSHDLKSPLTTIQSYAGMIKRDLNDGNYARAVSDLGRIEGAADKMTHLLNDLLKLSRLGRMVNESSDIDMNRLVNDCLIQLAGSLMPKQVEIVLQGNLPATCGDEQRLSAVVQNLIENAIKYMGDQVAPRIEIGARVDEKGTVFYVSDNGAGIDPLHHENIFGLFNKLDTGSAGTGVGLALVKRIVEIHGGRVWVESEGISFGSRFCFTLTGRDS